MRRIKKAILSLSLVAAMVMGEAGVAFAAEPQPTGNDTEISADAAYGDDEMMQEETSGEEVMVSDAETTEAVEKVTEANSDTDAAKEAVEVEEDATGDAVKEGENLTTDEADEPVIEDINLDKSPDTEVRGLDVDFYQSYFRISFSGDGCKFVINVNGKYFTELDNSDDANEDNPAPTTYYEWAEFRNILYGGTYKIDVIPYKYTAEGPVAGTAVSKTVSVPMVSIDDIDGGSYANYIPNGYSNGGTIGVSWKCDADIDGTEYEIQRKEGKGAWTTLGKTAQKYYTDSQVSMGKTYQYRVRIAAAKNEYGQGTAGKWKALKNMKLSVASADIEAYYEGVGEGVSLSFRYGGICSGYEIYRSTNKTKGYKKIAKTPYRTYVDKKVKSGTYYYKVRAYYYDETTGKTYYGDYSSPDGVKLILGSIYMNAKQTGTNQTALEWNPVKGVSSYEVWYKTGIKGDAYRLYKTTTGTKLKISGLSNDTGYYFKVRAKKNGSVYYTSSEAYCYIGFKAPQPSVTKSKVTSNKTKSAVTIKSTIKWDRIYGAKKIRIVGVKSGYDANGNYTTTEKVLKTLKGTATSYTLTTKLTAKNKGYTDIKVVAVNGKDEEIGWVYGYKKLNDTKKLTVKRTNNAGCVISWKAVPGATKYKVYRVTPYGHGEYIGETNKCTYKDLNVTPGVQYTYSIEAVNDKVNISSYGIVAKTYTHKLGTPKVKKVTNSSAKKATVNWNSVNYAKNYVVYRATSKNGKYKKVATVKNGKTTYIDKKLKKGKTYYYRVKATGKNAAGFSVSSVMSAKKSVKIKK